MKVKNWHLVLIGIFIGILILGFAVVIYIFKTPTVFAYTPNTADLIFDFLDKWASAGAPAMMLLAILVALGIGIASIRHTRDIQGKQYRQGLLNEIIEWAIDIRKNNPDLTYTQEIASEILTETTELEDTGNFPPRIFIDKERLGHTAERIYIDRLITPLEEIQVRNRYIKKVASTFENALCKSVETLAEKLTKHIELLQKCSDFFARPASNEEIALAIRQASEHSEALDKSAVTVLNEATEIKTKNMG